MKITSKQLKIIIKEELKPLLEAYSAGRRPAPEADRPYSAKDRRTTERFFDAISQSLTEHGRRIKAMEDKIKSLMGSSGGNTDPQ
jgi:hypothetical protein